MEKVDVAIAGGGMSGLLSAYFLRKSGLNCRLFEKTDRVGGWVSSVRLRNQIFEYGPNSILADENWQRLFEELNLQTLKVSSALKARYIWKDGRKLQLPLSPLPLVRTNLISPAAKISILLEMWKKSEFKDDVSVAQFFRERFHEDILEYIVDPFIGGIFAGNVDSLSMEACFPQLWDGFCLKGSVIRAALSLKKEKKRKKEILSFEGGLGDLVEALSKNLRASIHVNAEVSEINQVGSWRLRVNGEWIEAEHLILAGPSRLSGNLLQGRVSDESHRFLTGIRYERMGLWHSLWKKPPRFSPGFGCLIPRSQAQKLRGSLWPSELFPSRYHPALLATTQYFVGEDIPQEIDTQIPFVQKVLETDSLALAQDFLVLKEAIPQFELNHREKVRRLRSELPQNLHLVGNYLDGVGLSSVMTTSKKVSQALLHNVDPRLKVS